MKFRGLSERVWGDQGSQLLEGRALSVHQKCLSLWPQLVKAEA